MTRIPSLSLLLLERKTERIVKLRQNDKSTSNRRILRGLGTILDQNGNRVPLEPYVHQLYDVVWRRMMASQCGGAINADEPGFGKVCIPAVLRVLDMIIELCRCLRETACHLLCGATASSEPFKPQQTYSPWHETSFSRCSTKETRHLPSQTSKTGTCYMLK